MLHYPYLVKAPRKYLTITSHTILQELTANFISVPILPFSRPTHVSIPALTQYLVTSFRIQATAIARAFIKILV